MQMGNSELTHPASEIVAFEKTDDILQDMRGIINSSRDAACKAGKGIVEGIR